MSCRFALADEDKIDRFRAICANYSTIKAIVQGLDFRPEVPREKADALRKSLAVIEAEIMLYGIENGIIKTQ